MRTDELRAELQRLSDELEPFEPDAMSVHRKVRRHQAWISVAAAVAMIAIIAGAIAVTRSGSHVEVASSKKLPAERVRVDVIVVPQSAGVQAALEKAPSVATYAALPRGSYSLAIDSKFATPYRGAACALQQQPGFAVQSAAPRDIASELQAALGTRARVFDVKNGPPWDAEVFMKTTATSSEVANVRSSLLADRRVTSVSFLDHQAAYTEFKRIFADQPALIEGTKPSELPESFRLLLVDPALAEAFATIYEKRAGVDTVITDQRLAPDQQPPLHVPDSAVCKTP